MKLISTLSAALLFVTLIALGVWQLERLQWKEDLMATMDAHLKLPPVDVALLTPSEADYRPAFARGTFLHEATFYEHALERSTGEGGYHVLTAFQLVNGKLIIIDRGFIPFAAKVSGYTRPTEILNLKGVTRVPHHSFMQPNNDPKKGEWFWPDLAALMDAYPALKGKDYYPFILVIAPDEGSSELPRGQMIDMNIPNDHFGYALTWFSLAGILLIIFGMSVIGRRK